jgi:hypothetical protein
MEKVLMLDDPDRLMPLTDGVFVPRSKILYIYKRDNFDQYLAVVNVRGPGPDGESFGTLPKEVKTERDLKTWWNSSHS